jgi:SET domain-containing protein
VQSKNLPRERSAVEVRENERYKGVFATEDIRSGSVIFHLRGTVSTRPTKYTIQLGEERHLECPPIRKASDKLDYCWKYLNHSCAPNGYINAAELIFLALRDIAMGEEITFNYLTTESELAAPFRCICGSANCFGFIRGRNFLTPDQAESLALAFGPVH